MAERKCTAQITNLSLDGPIGPACQYPDGPCLAKNIQEGKTVVKKDEVFTGDCLEDGEIQERKSIATEERQIFGL
ncbi:MAG: hypothetical protein ABIJ05_05510 [Patescibacteria group bacterium]